MEGVDKDQDEEVLQKTSLTLPKDFNIKEFIHQHKEDKCYLEFIKRKENKRKLCVSTEFNLDDDFKGIQLDVHSENEIFWDIQITRAKNIIPCHVEQYFYGSVSEILSNHKKTWYFWNLEGPVSSMHKLKKWDNKIIQYPGSVMIVPPKRIYAVVTEPIESEDDDTEDDADVNFDFDDCVSIGYIFKPLDYNRKDTLKCHILKFEKLKRLHGANQIINDIIALSGNELSKEEVLEIVIPKTKKKVKRRSKYQTRTKHKTTSNKLNPNLKKGGEKNITKQNRRKIVNKH